MPAVDLRPALEAVLRERGWIADREYRDAKGAVRSSEWIERHGYLRAVVERDGWSLSRSDLARQSWVYDSEGESVEELEAALNGGHK